MKKIRVDVDVDLEDFTLREILVELEERYYSSLNREKNQKEINDFIKKMKIDEEDDGIRRYTIMEQTKIDFFMNNLEKIKLSDLEKIEL